jgi:hypothetical protein
VPNPKIPTLLVVTDTVEETPAARPVTVIGNKEPDGVPVLTEPVRSHGIDAVKVYAEL